MKNIILSLMMLFCAAGLLTADEKAEVILKPTVNKLSNGDSYDIYLPKSMPKDKKLPLYFIFSYTAEGDMLAKPMQKMVNESKVGLIHLKNLKSIMSVGKLRALFMLTMLDVKSKYAFHDQRIYFTGLKSGAVIAMVVAKWSKDMVKGLLLIDGCHVPIEGHPVVRSDIYALGKKEGRGLRTLKNLQKRLNSFDVKFEIEEFDGKGEAPSIGHIEKAFTWFEKEWVRFSDDQTAYGRQQRRSLALAEYKVISKLKSKKKFDVIYSKFEKYLSDFSNSTDTSILSLMRKAQRKMKSYSSKPDVMALLKFRDVDGLIKELPKNYVNITNTLKELKEITSKFPSTLAASKSQKQIDYWTKFMKERKIYVPLGSNEDVLKDYLAFVEKNVENEPTKKLIRNLYFSAKQSKQTIEFIPNSLMILDTSYQKGMIAFGSNKMKTATKYFNQITNEKNKFLQAYRQYYLARIHVIRENYEEAEHLIETLLKENIKYTTHKEDAFFLLAISLFKQFKREEAEALFHEFLKRFPDSPERMIVGASQMIDRIRAYEDGSLSDVEERMEYSKRKIRLSDMGEKSVKNQKKIVDILAKLIKEAEQQEQNQRDRNRQKQAGNGQSPSNPSRPAEESQAPAGESKIGDLKKFSRGKRNEMWGKSRKKEREKVLNNLKEKFPERYRQLIEQYFKGLQKDDE